MRVFLLFMALSLFSGGTPMAFGEELEPTYKSDPTQDVTKYHTGYVKPAPLTYEQHKTKVELEAAASQGKLTYAFDVSQIGQHPTGYVKPEGVVSQKTEYEFMQAAEAAHKQIDLRAILGSRTPAVLNQGNCGSCVVFAFTANAQWSMALRNVSLPILSPQHLMNCGGQAGQCNGDYGERVAARLIKLGALTDVITYPYTARSAGCSFKDTMPLYGQFQDWKTIGDDFQSVVEALNNRQFISAGVAADNRFSSYSSGKYNGFGSLATNHYVGIMAARCGSSVDKDGACLFNSRRQLVNGNHEAEVDVVNSWGKNWGDGGYITMLWENKAGRRNNNIGGGDGNMQVIETGLPFTPPEPVTIVLGNAKWELTITVKPGAKYTIEKVKSVFTMALNSMPDSVEAAKSTVEFAVASLEGGI